MRRIGCVHGVLLTRPPKLNGRCRIESRWEREGLVVVVAGRMFVERVFAGLGS